jgi:hypothetical protein
VLHQPYAMLENPSEFSLVAKIVGIGSQTFDFGTLPWLVLWTRVKANSQGALEILRSEWRFASTEEIKSG